MEQQPWEWFCNQPSMSINIFRIFHLNVAAEMTVAILKRLTSKELHRQKTAFVSSCFTTCPSLGHFDAMTDILMCSFPNWPNYEQYSSDNNNQEKCNQIDGNSKLLLQRTKQIPNCMQNGNYNCVADALVQKVPKDIASHIWTKGKRNHATWGSDEFQKDWNNHSKLKRDTWMKYVNS